ncbi:unnamed protein product [Leptidea sinapis]|uniref:Uncharacterized protein n=1 Tax=Leptidea sinapis TaxID=189913 RepID=A0A5E4QJC0_9NEOP|nr:unnamed protein product [Leptidea sinapis]
MWKVPARLPPRVRAGPPSKRVKRVTKRMVCRGEVTPRYSPVLKKNPDSPTEEDNGSKGEGSGNNKAGFGRDRDRERERRSADPRERVRKESETGSGIVLSPQRRSFTSGCGGPGSVAQPPPQLTRTRPESPLSTATPQIQKTEQDAASGSWEDSEFRQADNIYRPPGALRDRDRDRDSERDRDDRRTNSDRFERRSFNRDSFSSDIKRERDDRFNNEKNRDREDNRRSGGRYSHRRYDKEDEPEWFSGGPTSKLETIELRGFDEPIKEKLKGKDNEWKGESQSPVPQPVENNTDETQDKDSRVELNNKNVLGGSDEPEFNLDEFLEFDSIPVELTRVSSADGSTETIWTTRLKWRHQTSTMA